MEASTGSPTKESGTALTILKMEKKYVFIETLILGSYTQHKTHSQYVLRNPTIYLLETEGMNTIMENISRLFGVHVVQWYVCIRQNIRSTHQRVS